MKHLVAVLVAMVGAEAAAFSSANSPANCLACHSGGTPPTVSMGASTASNLIAGALWVSAGFNALAYVRVDSNGASQTSAGFHAAPSNSQVFLTTSSPNTSIVNATQVTHSAPHFTGSGPYDFVFRVHVSGSAAKCSAVGTVTGWAASVNNNGLVSGDSAASVTLPIRSRCASGTACTTGSQCETFNCIGGRCCSSTCSTAGQPCATGACNTNGNGCVARPAGATPASTCGNYLCNGTSAACPVSCTSDATCVSGYYCAAGVCTVKRTTGATCTTANQCQTGFCADGRCCSTACAGACNTCALTPGTCLNPANAGATNPCAPYVCTALSPICTTSCTSTAQCAAGSFCDVASSVCVGKLGNGSVCTAGTQCVSNNCVDGRCCDTACPGGCEACATDAGSLTNGTCSSLTGPQPVCGSFVCTGTNPACPTVCAAGSDCTAGAYCDGGACLPEKPNGAACVGAPECTSGICVDGVCCDGACTGQCARCDATGSCVAVTGAPIGARAPCAGGGTACAGACDGLDVSQCSYPPNTVACADSSCTGGTFTGASTCNGSGACVAPAATSCSSSACLGKICRQTCTKDDDCAAFPGHYCSAQGCAPHLALGAVCTRAGECSNGACVDGRCCSSLCTGECVRCDAAGEEGKCTPAPNGQTCAASGVCSDGQCADGGTGGSGGAGGSGGTGGTGGTGGGETPPRGCGCAGVPDLAVAGLVALAALRRRGRQPEPRSR